MTAVLDFVLPRELEAHEPPEARGLARDGVRLLVGRRGTGTLRHHRFTELPDLLRPGDVLVVNTSGTLPAALPVPDSDLVVHFSTARPDRSWLVELRRSTDKATEPYRDAAPGDRYPVRGGGSVSLRGPFAAGRLSESAGRLWESTVDFPDVVGYLNRYGQPIRYGYVHRLWPLSYYQTVFATHPGSAEMPSAGRPFSAELVTRLVSAGILVVPLVLHTGVASLESHEPPYPEWFSVPASTARAVAAAKRDGTGRVIAVGTTVVRALESPGTEGWTDLVVTPTHGVRVVDGLLTGFHQPGASHLDLLRTVAGPELVSAVYAEALANRYLWHEFGDVNLLLP